MKTIKGEEISLDGLTYSILNQRSLRIMRVGFFFFLSKAHFNKKLLNRSVIASQIERGTNDRTKDRVESRNLWRMRKKKGTIFMSRLITKHTTFHRPSHFFPLSLFPPTPPSINTHPSRRRCISFPSFHPFNLNGNDPRNYGLWAIRSNNN